MRPTGRLHLGHLHGCLNNWVELQHRYQCYFFVADWHALTTGYQKTDDVENSTIDMVVDWFAAGLDPSACTVFIQSQVPEHAELALLLGMVTPRAWLERVPTYKDQIEKLSDRDIDTFGFMGYPVLQAADILIYRGGKVPVGADQQAHVEVSRDIARRFNEMFGREEDFQERAQDALGKLQRTQQQTLETLSKAYQEEGDRDALTRSQALIRENTTLLVRDRERLLGWVEGLGRLILVEPEAELTASATLTGTDGQKMSKSYQNTINLRENEDSIRDVVRRMQTDPARVKKTDPGDPNKCPVFSLHRTYLDKDQLEWAAHGCRNAEFGCVQCKQPLIDAINAEQEVLAENAKRWVENPDDVIAVLREGASKAQEVARETLDDVRSSIGIAHRGI